MHTIQHQYFAKSLGLKYADILHAPLVQVKNTACVLKKACILWNIEE
jgi:hypothetical protein